MNIYRRLIWQFLSRSILLLFGFAFSIIFTSSLIRFWMSNQHITTVSPEYHLRFFTILLISVFIFTLGTALLFAKTLGKPLFHMLNWLQNLSQGIYQEPIDQRGVPRSQTRNGRLRGSFQIYLEVIESLQNLTSILIQHKKDREKLEQMREEWMTGISHDLKTPLTTAKGYAELVLSAEHQWNEEQVKKFVKIMNERMEYMEELIEDFQLTFQLKNNALPLNLKKTNIVELLRRSIVDLVNQYDPEDYPIQFHYTCEEIDLSVDQILLKRAFDNLIGNAMKHNPHGTQISISIFEKIENGLLQVIVSIVDNGIGMSPKTQKNLFNRYYRGKDSRSDQIGSGLGMNIAKKIIQAHNGTIEIESEVGKGTKLVICLSDEN